MTPRSLVVGVAAYAASAYILDGILRPAWVARRAREAARRRGKPLLNVGAGTAETSFRAALLGPTAWGDVNCDIAATSAHCADASVCWCDATRLFYPDKHFGAVIATHVLEHLDDPDAALAEWSRVADEVFVVVPAWWAPHTWLHPGHKWYLAAARGGGYRGFRLWP